MDSGTPRPLTVRLSAPLSLRRSPTSKSHVEARASPPGLLCIHILALVPKPYQAGQAFLECRQAMQSPPKNGRGEAGQDFPTPCSLLGSRGVGDVELALPAEWGYGHKFAKVRSTPVNEPILVT